MSRRLVRIKFGSHLYGTSTPESDLDYKSVCVPDARDILLQKAKGSSSTKRDKAEGEKNFAGELDEEAYSLQRFLQLVCEGQTVAIDVLFAPEWSLVDSVKHEWLEIISNRGRLLTKKSAAFLGYCRQQANKYGIKGRAAAARAALMVLDKLTVARPTDKLDIASGLIGEICAVHEHMSIDEVEQAGGTIVRYWNVCGRKLSFTATIKHARDVVKALVDEYGKRALQAESNEGVDWKALSHAVRVGRQAVELLTTAHVTFPRPEAAHLVAIKTGQVSYAEVSAEIEHLLECVERTAAASTLPDEPDYQWVDDFVLKVYADEVYRYADRN